MRDYAAEIRAASETRDREFKGPGTWNEMKWKIAKAAQAMANKRDGGRIIIGVREEGGGTVAEGLTDEQRQTFDADDMRVFINKYADPYVECEMVDFDLYGNRFLIIEVKEFGSLPVVCKNTGEGGLKQGAIYVRSYQKPETCRVRSQTEMRELLDVATERALRRFVGTATRAGIELRAEPSDDEKFAHERSEFMDRVLESEKLRRGCFVFSIRPVRHHPGLIPHLSSAASVVQQKQIHWYGWRFPFSVRSEQTVEQDCAGSPALAEHWSRFWRIWRSGHFLYAADYDRQEGDVWDYLDTFARREVPDGFKPNGLIGFHRLIRLGTYVFEFAARLTSAGIYESPLRIGVELLNTRNRVLVSLDPRRPLDRFWFATAESIRADRLVEPERLLADAHGEAVPMLAEILERFAGEYSTPEWVRGIQEGEFKQS